MRESEDVLSREGGFSEPQGRLRPVQLICAIGAERFSLPGPLLACRPAAHSCAAPVLAHLAGPFPLAGSAWQRVASPGLAVLEEARSAAAKGNALAEHGSQLSRQEVLLGRAAHSSTFTCSASSGCTGGTALTVRQLEGTMQTTAGVCFCTLFNTLSRRTGAS